MNKTPQFAQQRQQRFWSWRLVPAVLCVVPGILSLAQGLMFTQQPNFNMTFEFVVPVAIFLSSGFALNLAGRAYFYRKFQIAIILTVVGLAIPAVALPLVLDSVPPEQFFSNLR
jgi:hypothetical protein